MSSEKADKKLHFVLVHGSGGGAWCWYRIMSLMEFSGYKVSCFDLKGAGKDISATADSIHSMDDYNEPLFRFLSALPDDEQVILVGHSAGGLSVTHASHKFADKISLAVYVAATMLKFGFVTDEDRKDGLPDKYKDEDDIKLRLGHDHKPRTDVFLNEELKHETSYRISYVDSTLVKMLRKPPPMKALKTARFTDEGVRGDIDKVKRVYIHTMLDEVLKLDQQYAMVKKWPPNKVYSICSDHLLYFSATSQFFHLLVKAAKWSLEGE